MAKKCSSDVDFPLMQWVPVLRQDTLAEHTHDLNETHAFTRQRTLKPERLKRAWVGQAALRIYIIYLYHDVGEINGTWLG